MYILSKAVLKCGIALNELKFRGCRVEGFAENIAAFAQFNLKILHFNNKPEGKDRDSCKRGWVWGRT